MAKPITVLLFENDENQALLTKEALEKTGCVVDVARTGREGFDLLFEKNHDVYLIDQRLPDFKGVEVLRRIKTVKPRAVSIIVTGHGDEQAAVEAMKLGAHDYIVKSSSMGHLATLPLVIREGIDRQHLKVEHEELQTELWEQARLLEERNAELRRANEELKRLDQVRSDLISMVSHELRTPLATIKEFTAILSDKIAGPLTKNQEDFLGIVRGNIDRLARIIDDLLDMAKIEAGRIILTKGFTEVAPLIEHVVRSMQPLAAGKEIQLDVKIPEMTAGILADADKITQVLLNLVSNAVKFTDGGGRVTIRVEQRVNEVLFSVEDTGVGISPDDLPRLFQKFQQFKRVSAPGGARGTGLGLAISKRLVELHGGRIWATSQVNKGSTFFFTLPKYHVEEAFREYLRNGIERAKRNQGCLSIVVFAMANFDALKGLYGIEHVGGLLRDIEAAVKEAVRREAGDLVMRWQRGEMVVILAQVKKTGAEAIARRMSQCITSRTFTIESKTVTINVETAIATYPDDGMTEDEILNVTERRLAQRDRGRVRIMVVDDEPKIRRFLKESLELRDYDVVAAASGPDAIEQLKHELVDLILLDVMMPVMDGYEIYHLLKEDPRTKEIPVIIVTGKGERKDQELGMASASYNYVSKPFEMEDLLAKIRQSLQETSSEST